MHFHTITPAPALQPLIKCFWMLQDDIAVPVQKTFHTIADGEVTGKYKHGFAPDDTSTRLKISRADVADFMLQQLNFHQYLRKTPGLSY